LLYEGLSGLLFHHPGPFSPYVGTGLGGSPWGTGGNIYETNVVNNYGDSRSPDDRSAIDTSADPGAPDPDIRDASYDSSDPGDFDGGSSGGSDDTSV
jgi:hypothetical protein